MLAGIREWENAVNISNFLTIVAAHLWIYN